MNGVAERNRHFSTRARVLMLPVCLAMLAPAFGCSQADTLQYEFSGPTMGSTFSIKVLSKSPGQDPSQEVSGVIERILREIDEKMSTYRPDSEIMRLNAHAGDAPFPLSPELFEVLLRCREISDATDGSYDVTVAPLVNAWGFGPEGEVENAPTEDALAMIGKRVGYRLIELDRETLSARKLRPDVVCDVSAMAAGYAVDRIAETLSALGYDHFMVEVTREVRTSGHNAEGRPWQIAIERPVAEAGEIARILPVSDLAVATSGDYRKYREKDGVRLSHIIDPATRRPITHKLVSVSVIHRECATADGYATALMVLGPERGHELAVREGLAALFLIRDSADGFVEKTTPAFDAQFGAAAGVVK